MPSSLPAPAARRHVRDVDALFRLLVVMRQRLFEFLLDAERVSRGARPEFPQGVPIALALENVMRKNSRSCSLIRSQGEFR